MKVAEPVLISMGSGKGGVGKSLILANLAYLLAKSGARVALVDLDLGGPDLQILFGMFRVERSLSAFLSGKIERLAEIMLPLSPTLPLFLIAGPGESLGHTHLDWAQKQRLSQQLRQLPVDLVMVDVGAGTHPQVLDFYLEGEIPLAIGVPEPTSIFDLARFIKLATVRYVARALAAQDPARGVLYQQEFANLRDLLEATEQMQPEARRQALGLMKSFQPLVMINKYHSGSEMQLLMLQNFLKQFAEKTEFLGMIPWSVDVEEALRRGCPLYEINPVSPVTQALIKLAGKVYRLIQRQRQLPREHRWLEDSAPDLWEAETLGKTQNAPFRGEHKRSEASDEWELARDPFGEETRKISELQSSTASLPPGSINTSQTTPISPVSHLEEEPRKISELQSPTASLPPGSINTSQTTPISPVSRLNLTEMLARAELQSAQVSPFPPEQIHENIDARRYLPPEGFKAIDPIGFLPF